MLLIVVLRAYMVNEVVPNGLRAQRAFSGLVYESTEFTSEPIPRLEEFARLR